jgi:flagellar protein FliL
MAETEKTNSGTMPLVLGLLLITGLGLGAGFGLSKMMPKAEMPKVAEKSPDKSGSSVESEGGSKPKSETNDGAETAPDISMHPASAFTPADLNEVVLTPFAPITSNLALPESVWIRLEGSMAVKPNSGVKPADVVQLASTQMVAYVRTLKIADIEGATGFQALNADLNELARNATEGQVRAVLISGFIVE